MTSVDQRSTLVAALRARFGGDATSLPEEAPDFNADDLSLVEPKQEAAEDSIAYLSDFLFAHAQEDGALGGEPPKASTGDHVADRFVQMDRGMEARGKIIDALKSQLSRSSAIPKQASPAFPPAAPLGVELGPRFIDLEDDTMMPPLAPAPAAPPAKRMRTGPAHPFPPPVPEQQMPFAVAAQQAAEAAELAARKAAMLGALQAAELAAQPEAPIAAAAPPRPGPSPGSGSAPAWNPPQPEALPAGSSPEQYEEYRRKCWQQYYEYQSVWKKYYNQNQAEQSEKGKGKSKGKPRPPGGGAGHEGMAFGKGGLAHPGLGGPPQIVLPSLGGKGGPPSLLRPLPNQSLAAAKVAPKANAAEDIHSQLMGL